VEVPGPATIGVGATRFFEEDHERYAVQIWLAVPSTRTSREPRVARSGSS
jgi:hypothetical protein